MFVPRQTVPAPSHSTPVYQLDGHEFVPVPLTVSFVCRRCGQDSTAIDLGAAIASGRTGVYPECGGASAHAPIALVSEKVKDLCRACDRELSRTYLDVYFGRDPFEKDLCRDCRTKRAKTHLELFGSIEG